MNQRESRLAMPVDFFQPQGGDQFWPLIGRRVVDALLLRAGQVSNPFSLAQVFNDPEPIVSVRGRIYPGAIFLRQSVEPSHIALENSLQAGLCVGVLVA